jgi:hypothetical protein
MYESQLFNEQKLFYPVIWNFTPTLSLEKEREEEQVSYMYLAKINLKENAFESCNVSQRN